MCACLAQSGWMLSHDWGAVIHGMCHCEWVIQFAVCERQTKEPNNTHSNTLICIIFAQLQAGLGPHLPTYSAHELSIVIGSLAAFCSPTHTHSSNSSSAQQQQQPIHSAAPSQHSHSLASSQHSHSSSLSQRQQHTDTGLSPKLNGSSNTQLQSPASNTQQEPPASSTHKAATASNTQQQPASSTHKAESTAVVSSALPRTDFLTLATLLFVVSLSGMCFDVLMPLSGRALS